MSLLVKWLESMHVDLDITNKCSRKRNVHSTCAICLETCTFAAISINHQTIEINLEKCSCCGECVITCPLSTIEGPAVKREFKKRSLIYNNTYTPTVKELLIYKSRGLASVKMEKSPLNLHWETVIKQTNKLLIELKQDPIVMEKNSEEKFSRRAFLSSMQTGGKKLAKSMAPASWRMEANKWNLANYFAEYQFYTVELDYHKCTMCKACFTFCTQEVFHVTDSYLYIENDKCVNCTDCRDICQEDAIQIIPNIKLKKERRLPLFSKECQDCGQSFYSFQTERKKCPICLNRDPEWLSSYQ